MKAPLFVTLDGERPTFQLRIDHEVKWFPTLFLMVWLCGWAFFYCSPFFTYSSSISDPIEFVTVLFWTVGGLVAAYCLAWNLFGHEMLSLDARELTVEVCLGKWTRVRKFTLLLVTDIRVGERPKKDELMAGTIALECGGKTHFFGIGLSRDKSEAIVEALAQRRFLGTSEPEHAAHLQG